MYGVFLPALGDSVHLLEASWQLDARLDPDLKCPNHANIQVIEVLDGLLNHSTSLQGRVYVATAINDAIKQSKRSPQRRVQALTTLAQVWLERMILRGPLLVCPDKFGIAESQMSGV